MHHSLRIVLTGIVVFGSGLSAVNAATVSPGDILVAGQGGTVYHFSATGTDLGAFATGLGSPSWMTTDASGNIYVSEYTGARVDKFSPSGGSLLTITTPFAPGDVRVSSDGTIYVGDYFSGNVYRYSASGGSLGLFVATGLSRADFLAFDAAGNLYVLGSSAIHRISPTGVDLGTFASLPGAEGMVFDATGNLYISSFTTNIIEKYSGSGTDMGTFASTGLNQPYGLAFDGGGDLYAADYGSGNITRFSPTGADLGIFASGLVYPRDVLVEPGAIAAGSAIPEPSTLLLLGSGLAGLVATTWRRGAGCPGERRS
jgi:sugar lactone lactonase YvrE